MRLPSKANTFLILMLLSAATALLVPTSWTRGVRGFFQPVALVQWMTSSTVRQARERVQDVFEPVIPQDEARRLKMENEALLRMLQDQQAQNEILARQAAELSGLRGQWMDAQARIVLAPIVSFDASRRRESVQVALDEHTAGLVRRGQWVVAGLHETPTRELLGERWLIGQVVDVQTRLARVQLVTDPDFRTRVQVGRLTERGWEMEEGDCLLEGRGAGKMGIAAAVRDYFAEGGRLVAVPPTRELPIRLSVGKIVSSAPDAESSKHFNLGVTAWAPIEGLTHVWILVTPQPQAVQRP